MRGDVYAHEIVQVAPGRSWDYLELVRDEAAPVYAGFGWELAGAWETALTNDSECVVLWAIRSWDGWAELEKALRGDARLARWRARNHEVATAVNRFLLVDSPLSPMRTGRQPSRDDRLEDWEE